MKAFECKMCGKCCYGKGGIVVGKEEIKRISEFLSMPLKSFISDCCEKRNRRLYIKTGEDGFCVFYDRERMCVIHPVKPDICSLWPFYPANIRDKHAWELAKEACPGINRDCSFEDFVRQSKEEDLK